MGPVSGHGEFLTHVECACGVDRVRPQFDKGQGGNARLLPGGQRRFAAARGEAVGAAVGGTGASRRGLGALSRNRVLEDCVAEVRGGNIFTQLCGRAGYGSMQALALVAWEAYAGGSPTAAKSGQRELPNRGEQSWQTSVPGRRRRCLRRRPGTGRCACQEPLRKE